MKNYILTALIALPMAISGCTKGCNNGSTTSTTTTTQTATTPADTTGANTTTSTEPKVEMVDTVVGKGAEAVNGKSVTVHYTGTLKDGTQFDSSRGREPFTFTLGSGQVIKGWEQGIQGMKVGGKRKLTIPPELAYGNNAVGSIPANSTLLFDVELLDVK